MTSVQVASANGVHDTRLYEPAGYVAPVGPVAGQPLSHLLNRLEASAPTESGAGAYAYNQAQLLTPPPGSPCDSVLGRSLPGKADDPALVPFAEKEVQALLQEHIQNASLNGEEDAFFVGDLSAVYRAVQTWRASALGDRVEIFYAVKCNPSPAICHLLALMGTSFDCASVAEINLVLNLPSAPSGDRIIFANPCKPASFIRTAARRGVERMTFDNADELHKIARFHPNAKLVLRILTDDSKSLCRFGLKYGAPLDTCPGLLALARRLGLNVIGVSFHVGSGCKDANQFRDAVWRAKRVFEMGKKEGYEFDFLDVGGGFEQESFKEMSEVLSESLNEWFPREEGVRVVAEPGRFMVSSAFTLATSIIARRRALDGISKEKMEEVKAEAEAAGEGEGADVMYYINEGIYGSFNCILFDHQIVHPYPLTLSSLPPSTEDSACIPREPGPPVPANVKLDTDLSLQLGYTDVEKASIWGPTCDGIDCVRNLVAMPSGLEVGDWLGWGEMGAYTMCAASNFNGFATSLVHYTTGGQTPESLAVKELLEGFSSMKI